MLTTSAWRLAQFSWESEIFQVCIRTRPIHTSFSNGGAQSPITTPYWILDVTVKPATEPSQSRNGTSDSITKIDAPSYNSPAIEFLQKGVASAKEKQGTSIVRYIFPLEDGYIIRNDILVERLEHCDGIDCVESFVAPLDAVSRISQRPLVLEVILETLSLSVGALLSNGFEGDIENEYLRLDRELANRLSISWLRPEPIQRRRVVWVQGRENINVSRRAYQAAKALGVNLVVIDNPGHWLEDNNGPHAHFREAFIPVSIEVDDGFTQRIVEAVRTYPHPVDGLMTISDVRLPGVAQACTILGLPTSPFEAYQNAGDKARTRLLEDDAAESNVLSSATKFDSFIESQKGQQLQFPLVVKPTLGWNSDCVTKVANKDELAAAVQRASERHATAASPSFGVVIEPYIDGPEVDANLVLLDGEVIYYDIEDDFPTRGDAKGAGVSDSFQETKVLLPSALPDDEVQLLVESLRRSILRQGFTSGVFHCEARIRNSSVEYQEQDGILDIGKRTNEIVHKKRMYLHEINARPPGYLESVAVKLTHGVDYYALRILLSIGSSETRRILALSKPFVRGPQFHLCILIIPQTKAGIMKTEDASLNLFRRHPELREWVPDYDTYLKGGAVLEGPSARSLWWIANFSVISRTSRGDCLRRSQFIYDNFEYELE